MKKLILLGLSLCLASAGFATELLVKYPPLTAEETLEWAYRTATWFEKEIKAGRTEEALAELQKAPQWKLTSESWKVLKEDIEDANILKQLESFQNRDFTEPDIVEYFTKVGKISMNPWAIGAVVVKHAEEVSSTPWNKGSVADYRLVVTFHCEKKIYSSHAFFPSALNKPILDKIKDDTGKRYMWNQCNLVRKSGKAVWMDAVTKNPLPMHEAKMDGILVPVGDTGYQVGMVNRNLKRSIAELNALIK